MTFDFVILNFQSLIFHTNLQVLHLVLGHGDSGRRVQPRHGLSPQRAVLLLLLLGRRYHHGWRVVRYLGMEKIVVCKNPNFVSKPQNFNTNYLTQLHFRVNAVGFTPKSQVEMPNLHLVYFTGMAGRANSKLREHA